MPHNFSKDRSLVEDKPVPKPNGPLDDFEAWLIAQEDLDEMNSVCAHNTNELIERGLTKLEELKKKYGVP